MYLNLPPSRNLRLMLERFQPSWQASLASEVNLRLIDLRGIPKTVTNYLKIGNPMINSQGIYEVCINPLLSLMLLYSLLERKSIIPGGSGAPPRGPPRSPTCTNWTRNSDDLFPYITHTLSKHQASDRSPVVFSSTPRFGLLSLWTITSGRTPKTISSVERSKHNFAQHQLLGGFTHHGASLNCGLPSRWIVENYDKLTYHTYAGLLQTWRRCPFDTLHYVTLRYITLHYLKLSS